MQNIILLHGALGSAIDLKSLGLELSERGFAPHLFSFSGHGEKAFENEFGIDKFAEELHQYILQNQLQQPVVFGYSMGGYVALTLASKKPALLQKIITLATKFNWTNDVIKKEADFCESVWLQENAPEFAARLKQKHADSEGLLQRTKEMLLMFRDRSLSEMNFKQISIPVLLGRGDQDKMVTLEETLNTAKQLAKSNLYLLPSTKHPLETVRPRLLAELIFDFVKQPVRI